MSKAIKIILKYYIPEDENDAFAKFSQPDILDFFESEESRQESEQWKRERTEKDRT